MYFRQLIGTITVLAALMSFLAQGSLAQDARVNIGVDSFVLGAQAWVAEEQGFFEQYGVDANIRTFSLGVDAIDAVLTGQIDLAFGLDFATLTRLPSGQLRIVAEAINPEPGFHKLAVREGIAGPADLEGKRMGVAQGTAQQYITIRYLQVNDVPVDSVKLVPLGSVFDIVAAMRAGRIDAGWVWADGVQQAQAIDGVTIIADDSAAQIQPVGFLLASPQFVQEESQAAVGALQAMIDATEWINTHMEEASAIVADKVRAPQENVLGVMRTQHYVIELKQSSLQSIARLGEFMVEQEIVEDAIDPLEFVESEPLREADPERVRD